MSGLRRGPFAWMRTCARAVAILQTILGEWVWARLRRRSFPDVVHRVVVRLGPTFVKLGQIASTRPDLVPREVSQRLESLQENVPEFPFDDARGQVEAELGRSLDAAFATFPHEPIAAASLSQVYFAELPDGTPVAVKVQRPGIRPMIELDLAILRALARLASLLPSLRRLHLPRAVDEFGRWTLAELDFRLEGRNLDEFRANFADWEDVAFPRVHWSHTGPTVLTMERMEGLRLHEVKETVGAASARELAHRLAELEMKMFISDQFFHADLHPGNIFFRSDGSVAILDVGMVGRMTESQRDRFLAYWIAVSRHMGARAFHHLLQMAESVEGADVDGYQRAYEGILDAFYGRKLSERSLARTYLEVVVAGSRHGVVFPSALILQAKAVVTAEALTLVLAPDFEFPEEVRPIVARELARRATPERLRDRLWSSLPEWVLLGEAAPPGPPPDPASTEEDAFRRHAIGALASTLADATDTGLRRAGARLTEYGSADWWRHHEELRALLEQAAAVARFLAVGLRRAHDHPHDPVSEKEQLARMFEDGPSTSAQRWEAFSEAIGRGPAGPRAPSDIVDVLDRIGLHARHLSAERHWDGAHADVASVHQLLLLLRALNAQGARAAMELTRADTASVTNAVSAKPE